MYKKLGQGSGVRVNAMRSPPLCDSDSYHGVSRLYLVTHRVLIMYNMASSCIHN